MPPPSRAATSYSTSRSTNGGLNQTATNDYYTTTTSNGRPRTGQSTTRPSTARSRTGKSSIHDGTVICAVIEARGISPIVGIALLNLASGEAVLSQITDTQSYVRTIQKLSVYEPTEILVPSYATNMVSKLNLCIEENLGHICPLKIVSRQWFSDLTGLEQIENLAFSDDLEAIKISISGNYFAVCCFSAVMADVHVNRGLRFPSHSLRITYQPSEGSVMIDVSTIHSLELIQNIQDPKSPQCFFGLLNSTLTPMGGRYLRTNILQPSTDPEKINLRLDAVAELCSNQDMFVAVRSALKSFTDVEKMLTDFIMIPNNPSPWYREQALNRVIVLKEFVQRVPAIFESLLGARSELLLRIQALCNPNNLLAVQELILDTVEPNVELAKSALELRTQRNYAIKAVSDGMMSVARQAFKEAQDDAYDHVQALADEFALPLDMKFETSRQFYIRIPANVLDDLVLPPVFTNIVKRKSDVECQTLDLVKLNQKIKDCEIEILQQCEETINELASGIRQHMSNLYKCCESIALLDMLAAFANNSITQDYVKPQINNTLAIKDGRHPIKDRFQREKFIPNDAYATPQTRFQIITGCNMSGKSTYIRSIALTALMMQIGSFVPATHASIPIMHQLFARTSTDDCISANASTFALEMREMAFILRNIDAHSLVIVDELGRGTSTRDGLSIALAISEALIESNARVWFATHFKDLVTILSERPGVLSLHMGVTIAPDLSSMHMLYRVAEGAEPNAHYGLAMARVFPLPADMLATAQRVSKTLQMVARKRKMSSVGMVRLRKRKVLLHLKEHLEQASAGTLEGEALSAWLKELQREFVLRMSAIDEEAAAADHEAEGGGQDNRDE